MATGHSQAFSSRAEDIKKWQIQTRDEDETTISTANISTLYDGLMSFLKAILAHTRKQRTEISYYSSLEQSVATLFFWGRDFGVSQGELDTALQFSNRLRDTVLTLLIALGDLLILGLVQVVPTLEERQALFKTSKIATLTENAKLLIDEPMQAANYNGETVEQLCKSMQNITEGLIILGPSLEAIADDESDEEAARVWVQLKDRHAHEYFIDLISSRFPSASQQLVQALGQSNWDRYNYIQRLREIAIDEPTLVGTDKARSEFHDSGIGSSAPAQSVMANDRLEYAATVVSSRAETSHKRLPRLPEVARSGLPFDCEVCSRRIQIRRTKEWKKHIFEDICAYTCIFPDCSAVRVLFKDREAMTDHLESYHGIIDESTSQTCPLCLEEVCGGRDIVFLHFSRHMEEIALGVLPQGAESVDGSASSDDDDAEQPLHDASQSDNSDYLPLERLPGAISPSNVEDGSFHDTPVQFQTSLDPGDGEKIRVYHKVYLLKCNSCRRDKQKCTPERRQWPQRCTRCVKRGLPCSEGLPPSQKTYDIHREKSPNEFPQSDIWDEKPVMFTTTTAKSHSTNSSGDEEQSVIKCICGYSDHDGDTVLCESCDTWQHIKCYYESIGDVPNVHKCGDCSPRLSLPPALAPLPPQIPTSAYPPLYNPRTAPQPKSNRPLPLPPQVSTSAYPSPYGPRTAPRPKSNGPLDFVRAQRQLQHREWDKRNNSQQSSQVQAFVEDAPSPTRDRRYRWATEFDLELAMQQSLGEAAEARKNDKGDSREFADLELGVDVPPERATSIYLSNRDERYVNVREHHSKGHQDKRGRIIGAGPYVGENDILSSSKAGPWDLTGRDAQMQQENKLPSLSEAGLGRLTGEQHLGQDSLETSARAHDKNLLSRLNSNSVRSGSHDERKDYIFANQGPRDFETVHPGHEDSEPISHPFTADPGPARSFRATKVLAPPSVLRKATSGTSDHRRGPWSQHEDRRLIELVNLNGHSNWVRISQELSTRSPKQCRERYHQNIAPTLNHDPITEEEGELIEKLVAELGKRWDEIGQRLKGRSGNAVKTWWNGGQNRRTQLKRSQSSKKDSQPREGG